MSFVMIDLHGMADSRTAQNRKQMSKMESLVYRACDVVQVQMFWLPVEPEKETNGLNWINHANE